MAIKHPVALRVPHCLYPPPLPPHCFPGVRRSLNPSPPSLAFLYRRSCLGIHFVPLLSAACHLKSAKAVRFDGPFLDVREIEGEDCELAVETCITRTLQPALTLEAGLQSIKEALQELKQNPPNSTGGVLRFQVAVPPSPKALNWFCALPPSSGVFPRLFLSKETDDPACKSLYLNRTRGVLGIGAAIYFTNSSSSASGDQSLIRRYMSSDSVSMTTYGFVDVGFHSSFQLESGSVYFCIPEIELDELVDVSILSATLAWNESTSNLIRQAIQSLELSLYEASSHFWAATERSDHQSIASALGKSNLTEDKTFRMFSAQFELLEGNNYQAYLSELRGTPYSRQFCFRLSPDIGISNNMLNLAIETSYHLQYQANINAVWASLIVEECARLGLTFFCIAPGSRSSPLAIAASSHGKTTCIACFDERSLAFHAVGYSKGSQKPAVVITSSGTAVSNLLPAVVEASQDFVPLLLFTADRPPELQDTGANQTINQVNHFGSFVRFFFNLPVPSDNVPARMVLTVLDSAVNWATSAPYGPVHINCPFREPLDDSPQKWRLSCLTGLDNWMCKGEPFTKYIKVQHPCNMTNHATLTEVIEIIQGAKRGLLLICALDTEDDIWNALLLAKHLNWPVVADILSGLRLRKVLTTCPEIQENVVFLDHLDHVLLSDNVRSWIQLDVILQIGTRITSKRISQMLEECYPYSYILVDNHPCRHDPSHLVSHRIQCSVLQFVDTLLKVQFPLATHNFCSYLQALNKTVAWDISFQISAEPSLTEPHVAYAISEILAAEFALFFGNSMVIRDSDMYGCSWKYQTHMTPDVLSSSGLPYLGIRVSGNRGASGIDGLLSTASGFAAGCNRRVLCVIGDVSFLHDTNGLAMLNQRMFRKPMTVLVINNHGGAIFGLLPIADTTNPTILSRYFYTSHNISIEKLCLAHSVKHFQVKTKAELRDALLSSQVDELDCVIEAQSGIDANTTFHSTLRKSARQAADDALSCLSRLSTPGSDGFFFCKIHKMEYSLYRIELSAPTSASSVRGRNALHKGGYVLALSLEDGTVGYGEVAPIEIHNESLADAEEQLRFLCHIIEGVKIAYPLPLLKGTFTSWLWKNLGIPDGSIFPSVRCGLEMAILNAMAARTGFSLLDILQPHKATEEIHGMAKHVKLCALIDSNGTPHEVANIAASLVAEGFTAIKLKVARRENPLKDAAVLQEVRKAVGTQIQLRVDANRKWSFEEAILFGSLVKDCDLQYIEEPVQDEGEIIKFCNESGLPVALDETIDNLTGNPLNVLAKYDHPKIVAVVIKPSVVGGFEKAALIARWAHQKGKMAVVSSAFESGLALSTYVLFSYYIDMHHADVCGVGPSLSVAHGLGTYRWLKQDTTTAHFRVSPDPCSRSMGASIIDAIQRLEQFQLDDSIISRTFSGEQVHRYTLTVKTHEFSCFIRMHEVGQTHDGNVVVFLHGFLGTGEDWIPIMKAISGSARCISIDLPGHGETKVEKLDGMEVNHDWSLSVERVSELLYKLIQDLTPGKVTLVGYSMGARIALHMALRLGDKINGAVILSGSPGLNDEMARRIRRAKDDSIARNLITYGLQTFLTSWYAGKLWKSLRCHPHFKQVVKSRSLHGDVQSLANALSDLSIGRQKPLWDDLKHCKLPLLFVVGAQDRKFKEIAQQMLEEVEKVKNEGDATGSSNTCEILEVQESGHAVHLENPLPLINALRRFMTRVRNS